MITRRSRLWVSAACASLGIAACGSATTGGSNGPALRTTLAHGESATDITRWTGYEAAGEDDHLVT